MANRTFKTDAPIRGSLNTGLVQSNSHTSRSSGIGGAAPGSGRGNDDGQQSSEAYLNAFEEQLNLRVDSEIHTLVQGLEECVQLAKVGSKDKFKAAQDAVESELKAEQMIRATENLLSLSHTLKLLFLLSSEDEGTAQVEQAQREQAAKDLEDIKQRAKLVLSEVLCNNSS